MKISQSIINKETVIYQQYNPCGPLTLTFPLLPLHHNFLYYGCQVLEKPHRVSVAMSGVRVNK